MKVYYIVCYFIIIVCMLYGCNKNIPSAYTKQQSVILFENIVKQLENNNLVIDQGYKFKQISLIFDVEKTDSLISPFIGIIKEIIEVQPIDKNNASQIAWQKERRFMFAFQEKQWRLKLVQCRYRYYDLNNKNEWEEWNNNWEEEK
jgi:UDP-galactopyranose mutase